MALTPTYQLKTFADLVAAAREELKIQSTDTTAINRIKRDINITYLEEVVPFAQWKWLRGAFDATVYAAISAGTASVIQGQTSVTLTVPITSSKNGWLFGITGYNEIYRIENHTAGSATLTLQVPFTGATTTTGSYKIWTDEIYLPSFVRETFEVTHDFQDQPLENCGLQKFRQYVASLPRAEGRPYFYTTDTYVDPIEYLTPVGIPALASRASNTLTKTLVFATDVSNYLQQGDRIRVYGCSDATYNGEFVIASQSTTTITYTAMVPSQEASTAETTATVQRLQPASDARRAKRIKIYPAVYTQNTTLHIDHIKEVVGLADDSDEPVVPVSDRTVLLYGALHRAWSRERNPEEAKRNYELFTIKLARMAGKIDDSIDQPILRPNKVYLGSKRMAQRQRDTRGGLPEGWGGGGSGGGVATGNPLHAAIFDATGTLTASPVTSTELAKLSGIQSQAVGTTDTEALTNKTLDGSLNAFSNITLVNTDTVDWRNFAGTGYNTLGVDSLDRLSYNGTPVGTGGGGSSGGTLNPYTINVLDHGAVGDSSTDDGAAINTSIALASALTATGYTPTLWFPPSKGYATTLSHVVPRNVDVRMDATLLYTGSSNVAALSIGSSTATNFGRSLKLNVSRNSQSDWTSESNVGISLRNLDYSDVEVDNVSNFTINLQVIASSGNGAAYSNYRLGNIQNGKVGLDINSQSLGFPNENLFLGGNFANSVFPSQYTYGVRIGGDGNYSPNNNHFIKPSFQMGSVVPTGDVSASVNPTKITNLSSTANILVGDFVVSGFIPSGLTVASIDSGTQVTMSSSATGTATGTTINFAKSFGMYVPYGTKNRVENARVEQNSVSLYAANAAQGNVFESFFNSSYVDKIDPNRLNFYVPNSTLPAERPLSGQLQSVRGSTASPGISYANSTGTGFTLGSGGSGAQILTSHNAIISMYMDAGQLGLATASTTGTFSIYRTIGTGVLQFNASTNSNSGTINLYGENHPTKPSVIELVNNHGIGFVLDAAGRSAFSTTADTGTALLVSNGSGITGTNGVGIYGFTQFPSANTNTVSNFLSQPRLASGFLTQKARGFYATTLTLGSGSSATRFTNFLGDPNTNAANNAVFADSETYASNWFIHQNGTADTRLNGNVYVGSGGPSSAATTQLFNIQRMTAPPNSVPTSSAGYAPLVWVSPSSALYVYDSGWKNATGAGGAVTNTFLDNVFAVQNSVDATKQVVFNLAGSTTNTKLNLVGVTSSGRSITFPDANDTLVGQSTVDTLTFKTLSTPTVINTLNLSLGSSAGSLSSSGTGFWSMGGGELNYSSSGFKLFSIESGGQFVAKSRIDGNTKFTVGNSTGTNGYVQMTALGTLTDMEVYSPDKTKIMGLGCDNTLGYVLFNGAGNLTFNGTTINTRKTIIPDADNTYSLGALSTRWIEAFFSIGVNAPVYTSGSSASGSGTTRSTSSSGAVTVPNNATYWIFEPAATAATLQVTLPIIPKHDQVQFLIGGSVSGGVASNLSVTCSSGQTVINSPTTWATGTSYSWIYRANGATWYRLT